MEDLESIQAKVADITLEVKRIKKVYMGLKFEYDQCINDFEIESKRVKRTSIGSIITTCLLNVILLIISYTPFIEISKIVLLIIGLIGTGLCSGYTLFMNKLLKEKKII